MSRRLCTNAQADALEILKKARQECDREKTFGGKVGWWRTHNAINYVLTREWDDPEMTEAERQERIARNP